MNNVRLFCLTVYLIFPVAVFGQVKDAQLWENLTLEKSWNKKLSTRIVQEGRVVENWTRPSFTYFDVGATYKLNKHVHLCLAYVFEVKRQLDDTWSRRHQAYGDVTFRAKLGDFGLNDRAMLLWQVKDYDTSPKGRIPDYYFRNKLTLRYDRIFKWSPYLAMELYEHLNSPEVVAYRLDRMRYFAGLFYRPGRASEWEVYYLIEQHLNTNDPATNFVLGLGYAYSF